MERQEHYKRSSLYSQPHSQSNFKQMFQTQAPNQGEPEYARQQLEAQGILRPQSGRKRTNMDGHDIRSHQQPGANQYASNPFKRSTFSKTPIPTPEPRFKLPQPLQRQKQEAPRAHRSQSDYGEGINAGDAAVKRRRTGEPSSSPNTAHPRTPRPSLISGSFSSPTSRSSELLQPPRVFSSQSTTPRRDSLVISTPRVPTFQTPRSLSSPTGLTGASPGVPTVDAQASPLQSPPFRSFKKRPANVDRTQYPAATNARQQINGNGNRSTNTNDLNVPKMDRRMKDPPPDLESLNRLLHQVPGILTDLHKKQEQLIRGLATKVGTYEERIEMLETENANLLEHVSVKSKSFAEELHTKFTAMEERMSSQENKIAALTSRDELLQQQICGTHENTESRETLMPSANHPTPLSEHLNITHDRSKSVSQEPMSALNENYNQRESQEPANAFDAFNEWSSQEPMLSLDELGQRTSQEPTDMFDGLDHQHIQDSLDALDGLDYTSTLEGIAIRQ